MKMLRCEMEVMDAIDEMLMADTELMAEIEADIRKAETISEAEADEFMKLGVFGSKSYHTSYCSYRTGFLAQRNLSLKTAPLLLGNL